MNRYSQPTGFLHFYPRDPKTFLTILPSLASWGDNSHQQVPPRYYRYTLKSIVNWKPSSGDQRLGVQYNRVVRLARCCIFFMHFCTFIYTWCIHISQIRKYIACMSFTFGGQHWQSLDLKNWGQKHPKHPMGVTAFFHFDHPQEMIHGYIRWRWAPDPVIYKWRKINFINSLFIHGFLG